MVLVEMGMMYTPKKQNWNSLSEFRDHLARETTEKIVLFNGHQLITETTVYGLSFGKLHINEVKALRDDLMVQQQIKNEWEHMVGVIMLNQTGRKPVKYVLPKFLKKFPNPRSLLNSTREQVIDIIKPLGMYNIREKRLRGMSRDYLTWDKINANMLYGIGKYGSDSYEIFFKQNYSVQPTDKELIRYLNELNQNQ
jgi:methyl-CpG-binding domain protein 4